MVPRKGLRRTRGRKSGSGTVGGCRRVTAVPLALDGKVRFNIRGCGRLNSYHCQERHSTYLSQYWYQAECCQYDYCNSWASPQLGGTPPEPSGEPLALPLSHTQARQLQRTLSLSSPLPGFHASTKKQSEGLGLGLSLAALQRMYLFFNSSGLLVLPGTGS